MRDGILGVRTFPLFFLFSVNFLFLDKGVEKDMVQVIIPNKHFFFLFLATKL